MSTNRRSMLHAEQEAIEVRLQDLAGTEDGDRIRGIEGDGTRRYFKGLTARLGQEGVGLVSDLEPAAHLGTP
jgi:hypothetical protein